MRVKQKRKVSYRKSDQFGGIPALIVEGKFLTKLGFQLGGYYSVDYAPNLITISSIKQN